jgi:sigma-B regulation protein RsbU (phosphoserine phosphatase)
LHLSDGRLAFAIADISGKGIPAAMLMASLQAMLRISATINPSPREVCGRLNYHLHAMTDQSRFATFFYAHWDQEQHRLEYVNAGHNPPFLLRDRGIHRLEEGGIPLGILPEVDFGIGAATLKTGDLVVLYSDGITEATDPKGEEFGEMRLANLVVLHRGDALPKIQSRVLEAVRSWSAREQEDDMTLFFVRAQEKGEDGR